MSWGKVAVWAAALAVLEAVVSSKAGSSNVGGWLSGAGSAVNRFLDPKIPMFSTSSSAKTKSASTSSTSSTGTAAQPTDVLAWPSFATSGPSGPSVVLTPPAYSTVPGGPTTGTFYPTD